MRPPGRSRSRWRNGFPRCRGRIPQ
jgi:hypothetical protein